MPETGMDWWVIAGVLVAVVAAVIAWRQLRGRKPATTNTITHGSHNTQTGGKGETRNSISHGDNNQQGG